MKCVALFLLNGLTTPRLSTPVMTPVVSQLVSAAKDAFLVAGGVQCIPIHVLDWQRPQKANKHASMLHIWIFYCKIHPFGFLVQWGLSSMHPNHLLPCVHIRGRVTRPDRCGMRVKCAHVHTLRRDPESSLKPPVLREKHRCLTHQSLLITTLWVEAKGLLEKKKTRRCWFTDELLDGFYWLTPVPLSQTTTFLPSLSMLTVWVGQDTACCQDRGFWLTHELFTWIWLERELTGKQET